MLISRAGVSRALSESEARRHCGKTAKTVMSLLLRRQSHRIIASQQCRTIVGSGGSWAEGLPGAALPEEDKGSRVPWQAEHNMDIQKVTQTAIIHELTQQQIRTIEHVVPWFLNTMPPSYFRQVPESFRLDHIKAISAVRDANMDMYLNLQTHLPDGRLVLTFIRPGTQPGLLLQMVKDLPWNHQSQNNSDYLPLSRVQVFSALDDSMSLNMFVYGEEPKEPFSVEVAGARILEYADAANALDEIVDLPPSLLERQSIIEHMHKCSENYITRSDPRRFMKQMELFNCVSGTEGTAVHVEPSQVDDVLDHYWVDVAVANSLPQVALEHASRLLFLHNFDVFRSHLDVISDGENGNVTMLRMLAAPGDPAVVDGGSLELLTHELKRCKWLDPLTMDLVFERYPWLGVKRGEIVTAFCSLLHPIMAKKNALVYSKANILDTVTNERCIVYSSAIADLFLHRFCPDKSLSEVEFQDQSSELRDAISGDIEDTFVSELLHKMLDIVSHTLRTNIYMTDRYALGLRLDPKIMHGTEQGSEDLPYGVLFAHGRRFNAYHIRFRDISRGGLRLVTPPNPEQFALESAHQYDECYGLAYAQQLKNKDIPEGGSKAVNLINVNGLSESGANFVMRKSVKAFTDTILDLLVDTEETKKQRVDIVGKRETLYLGPDEQVTPEDIEWIVKRAALRGYDTPNAFMSSKPKAGINHKEYGVTSEGVNIYLEVALRKALGINPTKDAFTIKMTGGPDGDVAGNEIKILIREYGENAKIVGIADHSGCAEDPRGLDHSELLRLVDKNLCIANFRDIMLGENGVVHHATDDEGVKARNNMHNRLEADAFVPAGGRPFTIDEHNYRSFLKADGSPSSPLIVEGANLFITADARQKLFDEAKVVIVKDSSANKGGVVTSSYEIIAAMLCSDEEFNDNKEAITREVLKKLKELAHLEAELLFREVDAYPGCALPEVSDIISNSINAATDAITAALKEMSKEDCDSLLPLFRAHLPPTLADMAFDRVSEVVPEQYIKGAIASCLASKFVYKEGSKFVNSQPEDALAKVALRYAEKEQEMAKLNEVLQDTDIPHDEKERIIALLDAGGARTALTMT